YRAATSSGYAIASIKSDQCVPIRELGECPNTCTVSPITSVIWRDLSISMKTSPNAAMKAAEDTDIQAPIDLYPYIFAGSLAGSFHAGSFTLNVEPTPSSLSYQMRPAMDSISAFARYKLRP